MVCPECGVEMHIVSVGTRPEQERDALRVYHVAKQRCGNPKCGGGSTEHECKTVLWEDGGVEMRPVAGPGYSPVGE